MDPAHQGDPADDDPTWGLVGGCPSPGDPAVLGELVGALQRVAATLEEEQLAAVSDLGFAVGGSGWGGPTAAAFLQRYGKVASRLGEAVQATLEVAAGLAEWRDTLHVLKGHARDALEEAVRAHELIQSASEALAAADDDADTSGIRQLLHDATTAFDNARRQIDNVRAHHGQAAEVAATHVTARAMEPAYHDDLFAWMAQAQGITTATVSRHDDTDTDVVMEQIGAAALARALQHLVATDAAGVGVGQVVSSAVLPATEVEPAVADSRLRKPPHREPIRPPEDAEVSLGETEPEVPTRLTDVPSYTDVAAWRVPVLGLDDVPVPVPLWRFDWDGPSGAPPAAALPEPDWIDVISMDPTAGDRVEQAGAEVRAPTIPIVVPLSPDAQERT